ncbi:MAG: ABC transporter, partial [Candidatus Lindowbacteria bacterium]|nr:ABC transporter [Candidatus Lindowbacteria bacterium]
AKHLCVRVEEDGVTKAKVSLPWRRVDDLEDLMPEDVLGTCKEKDIDLTAIKLDARRRCYEPSTLFELKDKGKSFRVWLE